MTFWWKQLSSTSWNALPQENCNVPLLSGRGDDCNQWVCIAGKYISRSCRRSFVWTRSKANSMHVTFKVPRRGIYFHLVEQNKEKDVRPVRFFQQAQNPFQFPRRAIQMACCCTQISRICQKTIRILVSSYAFLNGLNRCKQSQVSLCDQSHDCRNWGKTIVFHSWAPLGGDQWLL